MTKILIDEAVVRQALEYLNLQKMYGPAMGFGNTTVDDPITDLRQALADAALDKMADNARELGLSYDASVVRIDTSAERVDEMAKYRHEPVAWMPIDSAPNGRIVLVYYKNSLGNGRTMRARYYLPETLDSDSTESGWADEGWYEESEAYEYLMPLEYEPTHWMPLPAAPDTQLTHTAPQKREWVGLTDEEVEDEHQGLMATYIEEVDPEYWSNCDFEFAKAIEAKLREKNT